MTIYQISITKKVPAHALVEVEADSLEDACEKLRQDLQANGEDGLAASTEFTSDWQEATMPYVDNKIPPGAGSVSE